MSTTILAHRPTVQLVKYVPVAEFEGKIYKNGQAIGESLWTRSYDADGLEFEHTVADETAKALLRGWVGDSITDDAGTHVFDGRYSAEEVVEIDGERMVRLQLWGWYPCPDFEWCVGHQAHGSVLPLTELVHERRLGVIQDLGFAPTACQQSGVEAWVQQEGETGTPFLGVDITVDRSFALEDIAPFVASLRSVADKLERMKSAVSLAGIGADLATI
ncbi:hypothetical protein B7R54_15150 [Subtercola boreus]|uniref:Uncharacterized protein n=1 Tax=Subtercola boreus TaxID=120213 RepID=A0A3E0VLT8_9MICO|nr:hypothetical protein [Subtercola boreus]RFA10393.1 hypothetical protein B7R54_15150 [Subtercola boreus]TQL56090.1 hypothetical protein FB464_3671 [Subtercola boreus]